MVDFPLFRKYNGVQTYFKIKSESSFQELKISESFYLDGKKRDVCFVSKYKNGFGYVVYYNANVNKTTSGWIDLNDLERYNPGC